MCFEAQLFLPRFERSFLGCRYAQVGVMDFSTPQRNFPGQLTILIGLFRSIDRWMFRRSRQLSLLREYVYQSVRSPNAPFAMCTCEKVSLYLRFFSGRHPFQYVLIDLVV